MELILSFTVGVFSSVVATGLLLVRQRARYRLRFQAILRLVQDLTDQVIKDGYNFDCIVAMGRNSGVVGSIMAGFVGLSAVVSISMKKSRLPDGTRTIELDRISEQLLPALSGRRVLLLLCCNDSGASLAYLVNRLTQLPGPPDEVRTAAVYTAPSPAYMPHYRAVVVGKDTQQSMTKILEGLPWATSRWIHPFANERRRATAL